MILAVNNESYQAMAAEAAATENADEVGVAEQNERETKLRRLMGMVKVDIRFH